ncbi:hypothetical protein OFC17_34815, partial [Escherichia coli]|nr:hypothetical protein [Escherichia coli]
MDKRRVFAIICTMGLFSGMAKLAWDQQKQIAALERQLSEARSRPQVGAQNSEQTEKESARKLLARHD